jgi:hypothetical protein
MVGELFLVAVTATCTAAAVAIVTGSKVDAAHRRAAAAEHKAAALANLNRQLQATLDRYEDVTKAQADRYGRTLDRFSAFVNLVEGKQAREFAGHDCHWP